MPTTTSAVASAPAEAGASPHCCSHCARGRARAASPNTPLSTPMVVMPIWMADKKRVGSCPSLSAASAALSPSSIHFCKRALRAVTNAISAMANKPLSTISAISTSACIENYLPLLVHPTSVNTQQNQQAQCDAIDDKHPKATRRDQAHKPHDDAIAHGKGHRRGCQGH